MHTSHNAFTGLTGNTLFHPVMFLKQAYAVVIGGGSSTIRTALFALRTYFSPQPNTIVQTPPALASFPVQTETGHAPLDVTDTNPRRADNAGKWLALKEQCSALINKNKLNEAEKSTLKKYYQEVLSHLFSPKTVDQDLKHAAAFAEKFYIHLDQPELEQALHAVLAQQTAHAQKWQELARVNFHLCVTLSGFATLKTLKDYGVDCTFLLGQLAAKPAQAEFFLNRMQTAALSSSWLCNTALIHAIKQGATEIVARLLETDPGCIDVPRKAGQTTLFWAVSRGNTDITRLLLGHGADVNAQNTKGRTALICACDSGKDNIVKLLLEHHADTSLQDKDGRTALTEACARGRTAIVRLLLQHDAGIIQFSANEIDEAIHVATQRGHEEIARLLQEAKQKAFLAFEEECRALLDKNTLDELEKIKLKAYHLGQLTHLLTEEIGSIEDLIRSTITLAEKFDKHIPRGQQKIAFLILIANSPGHIINQPERVAVINYYL